MRRFVIALAAALGAAAACRDAADASRAAPVAGAGEDAGHPLCVDGRSVDGAYPKAAYELRIGGTAPDLSFDGEGGPIALHDYFEPCARASRLLVVRAGTPWCGSCLWHLKHTGETRALDVGGRLVWLDLLLANRDNDPPRIEDLAGYRALIDAPDRVALDPRYQLAGVDSARNPLPLFVLVDTRTMRIVNYLHDPEPSILALRVRQELASLDRTQAPSMPQTEKLDGRFSRNQWDLIHDMTVPGAPPPDPTNSKADDPAAAAFGKQLFSDQRLSPSGLVSCGSCHDSKNQLQDGLPQSHDGLAPVDRNAPALALAAHARWQFWDGRADTLWMQALGPIENEKEFGSSRLFVAHTIVNEQKAAYSAIFGPAPDLSDLSRFPARGRPGDPAWEAMTASDRATVTDLFVNVGKAIAAYERTLRVKPNKLDAYVAGDLQALSDDEKDGLVTFFTTGCIQCHWGPRLTDDAFHPDRFPTGRSDGQADRGRIDGIGQLLASEFAQPHPALTSLPSQLGSFKTSSLRGIAGSAPYGHGGTLTSLRETTRSYSTAGLPASDPRAVGTTEPWLPLFAQVHADHLVPFLQTLTADLATP